MYKQQKQTKNFFNEDAKNWESRSDFKKNKIFNIIQERNSYVLRQIKKYKLKSLLDVGCGMNQQLIKDVNLSIGIDYVMK